jgi:phosphoglycerate dehydrogenase-like enzyme
MKVKVSNVAFSMNQYLVDTLMSQFPDSIINANRIRFNGDSLVEYFKDAEAVIVGLELITAQLLDKLPNLKIIAKFGVGLDNIDLEACRDRGIVVGWKGGVNKRSVAEMTLGFMLALCRNLYSTSNELKSLYWNKNGGTQLSGKKIGIIGVGNIGKEVMSLLKPFGCEILMNDIIDLNILAKNEGFRVASKEQIFREADLITLHVPFRKDTENLINAEAFALMKPSTFLINTARGGIINEYDLKLALKKKQIAGAALDVYETEPPLDLELLSLPNLICTPHTGGNSSEAVVAMGLSAISHLINYYQSKNK